MQINGCRGFTTIMATVQGQRLCKANTPGGERGGAEGPKKGCLVNEAQSQAHISLR